MTVLIIEDEQMAVERLQLLLQQYDPRIRLAAALESISETIKWCANNPPADLIFMDIQLADGSAFEIFKLVRIAVPVIFTTAYDQYALEAFAEFSIDYLLKPITLSHLSRAIGKMKALRNTQRIIDYGELVNQLTVGVARFKSRFLGKIGQKLFFIDAGSVAFFYADNKIVYLVTLDNSRYLMDHTLEELESQLDPGLFFRINRSVIIHVVAIEQVKPYINSRLRLILKNALKSEDLFISRERVAAFKKWADS